MIPSGGETIKKLARLMAAPTVEPSQRATHIRTVETDIVLPLKGLIIVILFYFFFLSGWIDIPESNRSIAPPAAAAHARTNNADTNNAGGRVTAAPSTTRDADALNQFRKKAMPPRSDTARRTAMDWMRPYFLFYIGLNAIVGAIFISKRALSLRKLEWIVFGVGVLDAVLMGGLTFLTEGFESNLYFVFLALILRNALAIPVARPQILLNCLVSAAYVIGGELDKLFIVQFAPPDTELRSNVFVERLIMLLVWAICCYSIQVLFEKQKRAEAEATEFAVRQERLHTAGRLAAEIAHQIKNPLGIITNAAFCLERAVRDGELAVEEQIQIIREEVERADQIITELMGYAQLAEGKVERLEVAGELDDAIRQVFPAAAKYQVKVHKHYDEGLPVLLMQKRHLSGVLVNLLQNAREAMNGRGEIVVEASCGEDESITIVIADTGPGIAPDKIEKIFDAYFTTREKGTGLGLAIVKHNTEMYGGRVTVLSELGRGTRFIVQFPARILMRLSK
jgi:signal transduction histidine kinase